MGNPSPYVYTNPPNDVKLTHRDKVFVLSLNSLNVKGEQNFMDADFDENLKKTVQIGINKNADDMYDK